MKINYPKVAEHLGVPLRGNETFDEVVKNRTASQRTQRTKTADR